ncbi:hypothetical protein MJN69_26990, partial [Salmonella enterica subsp. enterica serovar Kentucky]|nr:hypothetical protein [Salmonella enterica subsp. enterica serovar Kentucky]
MEQDAKMVTFHTNHGDIVIKKPFALNHASLTAAYSRKKNGKAISAQHFNFHPVLTSLFHFCYT